VRSQAVRGLVALLVVALAAIGAASARGQTPPFRVTIFGDSVADVLNFVPEARRYLEPGLDVNYQLAVCRRLVQLSCPYEGVRPPTVLDVVRAAKTGDFGTVAVVDVGYNDYVATYKDDMGQVVQGLLDRGVKHVIWTTLTESRTDYKTINQIIRAAPSTWPQVTVADWNAASEGQDWFNPDGIHLNAGGALGLAQLLRPAILAICGDPCNPPPSSPSVPGSPSRIRLITASAGSIIVGGYRVWHPPARATFAEATAAYGPPSACRSLAGGKSRVSWSPIGVKAQFIGSSSAACADPGHLSLQTLTVDSSGWKTSQGLTVGDSLTRLERVYPAAAPHTGGFWLLRIARGKSHAVFSAVVRKGRVSAFSFGFRVTS
jgi:hypothetical protein